LGTTSFFLEAIVGAKAKILMVRLKPVTSQWNSQKQSSNNNLRGEVCETRKVSKENKA
jgi:hypothetical protein